MDLHLKDHTAVVVGGASGIGLAAARTFATEGAHVVLWDQSAEVSDVARQLGGASSVPTAGMMVDVADESAVRLAMDQTLQAVGRVDHLVHAAAIGSGKFGFPFTHLQPADWLRVLQVNVMGMTHVVHAVAPHMVERRG